tara:strand:- start:561 stop:1892 length:1332 start_codon:yes stop_codon:yes gene_type:complete
MEETEVQKNPKVEVKDVGEINPDIVTPAKKEATVLEKAVEEGKVDPAYGLQKDGVYKINVDKPPQPKKEIKEEPKPNKDAIQESSSNDSDVHVKKPEDTSSVQEMDKGIRGSKETKTSENKEEVLKEESTSDSPLELIKEEPKEKNIKQEKIETPVKKEEEKILQEEKKQNLPEGVEKLVQFMEETGGTLDDYAKLNRDYSKLDNVSLLQEYYEFSKPHLDKNDIKFLMDKNFAYDEEADDPSDIKAKQLAFKEELYNAQVVLNNAKEKYYSDLKLRKQNEIPEQHQKALEYYNNSQQQQERTVLAKKDFLNKTNKVFNEEFKGFDFKVGENKYRVKIEDSAKIKESQSDIRNFLNKYSNKEGGFEDIGAYHKAIYAAQNADKIANHFYEQGRADAIKDSAKNAKNINMDPRQSQTTVTTKSGDSIRVVSGDSSDKLRIKWKQ